MNRRSDVSGPKECEPPVKKVKNNFLELVKNSKDNNLQFHAYLENKKKEEDQYKKFVEFAESVVLKSEHYPDQCMRAYYIECEARIGRDLKSFTSDINTSHFEGILKFMNSDAIKGHFMYSGLFESVDFIFKDLDDIQGVGSHRLTCLLDEHDNALNPISYIKKRRLEDPNSKVFIPSFSRGGGRTTEYFSRVSLSEELSLPIPEELRSPDRCPWYAKRIKRRYSWTSAKYQWRLDMSKVDTIFRNVHHNRNYKNANDLMKVTNEIEIELIEKNFDDLLYGIRFVIFVLNKFVSLEQSNLSLVLNDNDIEMALKKLYLPEENASNFVAKSFAVGGEDGPKSGISNDSHRTQECIIGLSSGSIRIVNDENLIRTVLSITKQKDPVFPGSMPVNLTKSKLNGMKISEYYISEKTDGIRYLLLICVDGVYLIDRSFVFYLVPEYSSGPNSIMQLCMKTTEPTLFDGELVFHYKTKKPYFLLFDCITYDGRPYSHLNTTERLKPIGEFIEYYRKNIKDWENIPPFYFLGKLMTRLTSDSITAMKNRIKTTSDGTTVFNDNNKRYHLSDGIILTPSNEPYKYRTSENLFKWKYSDRLTIDFQLQIEDISAILYLQGCGHSNIRVKKEVLLQEDMEKIVREGGGKRSNTPLIVEMYFDKKHGVWRPLVIRKDKDRPNHYSVAFSTMETMCENLTADYIYQFFIDKLNKR